MTYHLVYSVDLLCSQMVRGDLRLVNLTVLPPAQHTRVFLLQQFNISEQNVQFQFKNNYF